MIEVYYSRVFLDDVLLYVKEDLFAWSDTLNWDNDLGTKDDVFYKEHKFIFEIEE